MHFHVVPRMPKDEHAALTEHDVEIQLGGQSFILLKRKFVKGRAFRIKIVGSDNGRVAPGISAADSAFFKHCHFYKAMHANEIIGCSKTMPSASDHNRVIGRCRFG